MRFIFEFLQYVDVVAQLPPFLTRFNYLLHPVIALIKSSKNFVPVPNEEVEFCFTVPLERFLRRERLNVQRFRLPNSQKVTLYGFTDTAENGREAYTYSRNLKISKPFFSNKSQIQTVCAKKFLKLFSSKYFFEIFSNGLKFAIFCDFCEICESIHFFRYFSSSEELEKVFRGACSKRRFF
jgi:hypothetical protein